MPPRTTDFTSDTTRPKGTFRIATFNLENLFGRYRFIDEQYTKPIKGYEKLVSLSGIANIISRDGEIQTYEITDIQRQNTAACIADVDADILCVNEVESLPALRLFNNQYLGDLYHHIVLIDGNDPRGIDIGVLVKKSSKIEIEAIRTNMDLGLEKRSIAKDGSFRTQGALFSRDCLELDINCHGRPLTILANHLKAQDRNASSVDRRRSQAEGVKDLALQAKKNGRHPVVLGDLNVDLERPGRKGDDSLRPLLGTRALYDPFKEWDLDASWTHAMISHNKETGKVSSRKYSRLDYILVDAELKTNIAGAGVHRYGLSTDASFYSGPRYQTVDEEGTEASDHCPIWVDISM